MIATLYIIKFIISFSYFFHIHGDSCLYMYIITHLYVSVTIAIYRGLNEIYSDIDIVESLAG